MKDTDVILPKVSVIVAIYNMADYLDDCLKSLQVQTFHDFEVLLVNDGSTDNSLDICEKYKENDSRFRIVNKENGGVASARQAGLDNALGEYIIHVDPDDCVDEDMLEGLYNQTKETCSDMVICDFYEETEKGVVYKKQQPSSLDCNNLILQLFKTLHGSCCNKLVKRDSIVKFGVSFPPLSLCEDTFFCVSMLLHPIKVSYLNKAYYHYNRTNISSVTRKGNPKTGLYSYEACCEFRKLLEGRNDLWNAFIRDMMPWMAYLTLYYGAVTKKQFLFVYSPLNKLKTTNRIIKQLQSALRHYYRSRFLIEFRKKASRIKKK